MGNDGITVSDALALTGGRNYGYDNNNGGFGDGNGAWWIIILVLFFAFGGWGNGNGWGNGGRDGGNGGYNSCCTPATAQGVTDAFNFNQLDNGIRGISQGLCDGFYATNNSINAVLAAIQNCCCDTRLGMCQGFNGVQQSIANLGFQNQSGFNGIDKSIMQSDFHVQSGFNGLSSQIASCCCDLSRGQGDIQYAMAKNTSDIITANERNTNQILNYLTQSEMDRLRTELQSAQFQLSQLSQTSNIVNQLMPVAKPAYITCSPYASAFGYPFQTNSGCGTCGCA